MNGFTRYWNHPNRAAYLSLTPSFLVLLLFIVIPLLGTFAINFVDLNILFISRNFISSENFIRIFGDERAANSLIHSLYFAVLETPTQIIIDLSATAALSENTRLNRFCRSALYIPIICLLTSTAIISSMLLDPNVGAIPYLFSQVSPSILQFSRDPTFATPMVVIMIVWKNFGVTMTTLLTTIQGASPSLYESAQMDGATNRQQFLNITPPQIVSSLGFHTLMNLIDSMQVFDQVYTATTGGPQFKAETVA